MQEEATQRVREMQRRAQITTQRAQEELEQKNTAQKPEKTAQPLPAPSMGGGEKPGQPHGRPLEPERTPHEGKQEAQADRFAFLESEPQRPAPAAGRARQQKHISMPVDFIQEKQGTPAAGGALPNQAGDMLASSERHDAGPEPGRKNPLNLLEGGSDQSLLLALMLLLNGEGTDELLLLALLYMMM